MTRDATGGVIPRAGARSGARATVTRKASRARRALAAPERGAALFVAMVMLFVLSILGVSAMRGSTMEQRMADNAVQTSTVFQAAESATERALNDSRNLGEAFDLNGERLALEVDLELVEGFEARAALSYIGDGVAFGYSFGEGSNNFQSLRYDADGEARIDAVRAYSSVTQGAYRVVPAP